MESPYNIKHWSPVKEVPKSIDGWGNVLEWEQIDADEYGDVETNIKQHTNTQCDIRGSRLSLEPFSYVKSSKHLSL